MEPITTTTIISTIVGYLAKTLKDNKTFDDFTKDFTSATINWIRPLFIEEEKPKEVLVDLNTAPDDTLNTDAAENTLAKALKKEPNAKDYLQEIYETIKAKESKDQNIRIVNSKNIITGNVNVTGNFIVGDNNNTNK